MSKPSLRFLSLFVPNLDEARLRYQAVFGVEASYSDPDVPTKHPFAKRGPVIFDLQTCKIALYECDMRATHPGDVGIGVDVGEDVDGTAQRAASNQGTVFFKPKDLPEDERAMAVFMLPDRHFFEVVGKKA